MARLIIFIDSFTRHRHRSGFLVYSERAIAQNYRVIKSAIAN
ncbi:hypothetical protein [Nostoc commune]|nr:hypothetical protein [Nostoc commune]